MFKKLRNRIIIITMAVTTVVLILSGTSIMLFSSTTRPEPLPHPEPNYSTSNSESNYDASAPTPYNNQDFLDYVKNDRKEGDERLLIILLCVGAIIEIAVFFIIYYTSQKIVDPVKNSYDKQKIFIANASHELKTPLAVIQANIEALDIDKSDQKWKDNIDAEITHANKLVLDLLQLAKMDAGSIKKSATEKVNLPAEIKKRIAIFKPKFSGNISFNTANQSETLTLPKQDFLQILDILLDNATKYGDKEITISLDKNNLLVANDGAIISKEDQEKVFDRFYQTDKTKEGSGLGLAIAKSLCEQNDWKISCQSDQSTTTFIINLAP